jgi:hypothetical protein
MEVGADNPSLAAFGQKRHRLMRSDWSNHEVGAPRELSIGKLALSARRFYVVKSYYVRHV